MTSTVRIALGAIALSFLPATLRAQTPVETANSAFGEDVHAAAGLTCAACHVSSRGAGALPIPARTAIAPLCATCHSDAAYMRRFDPQVRIDQFLQYQTSVHGKRMAAADERVATCTDCHGAHGIKRVNDARSPVAPLNVTTTCGRCHGDPARMKLFGREATPPARLVCECPCRRAYQTRRHVCADMHRLSRQSRCDTARGDVRRQRLRAMPRKRS